MPLFVKAQEALPYDLNKPIEILTLPKYLEEISGLSYYHEDALAMLNDEHGDMYIYDLKQKKVIDKIPFKGKGDFEGIERVRDQVFAVKSNGTLYKFQVGKEGVVEKIKTPFEHANDIEGLAYDPFNDLLLFALKGSGDVGAFDVKGKGIYAYDLSTALFIEEPTAVVLNKEIEELQDDNFHFRPSGLAIHPISKELYVLSASDPALVVFDQTGRLKNLIPLNKKLYPQPEGITFAPSGRLYISNERKGGGKLLVFEQQRDSKN